MGQRRQCSSGRIQWPVLPRELGGVTVRRLASLWRHKHAHGRLLKLLFKDEARLPNF